MDAPSFDPRFSNKPSRAGVVLQSKVDDPTSEKPKMVNTDIVTGNSMYKTELCKNFMVKGTCRYGVDCIFAHGFRDKRKNALEWQRSFDDGRKNRNSNVVNEITYSKGTCKFFFSNRQCPYGNKCAFMHQGFKKSEEIRDMTSESCVINIQTQTDDFDSETNPWLKTRLCNKWMMSNCCAYGAKCNYAHGRAELRSPPSIQPESRNTWIALRTSKKNEPLPYTATEQTAVQKAPQTICAVKWKATKKIVGIYADWIDEELPMQSSASEQVP